MAKEVGKKGGYDPDEDKLIKDLGAINDHMRAEVRQYGGGPKKIVVQLLVGKNKDKTRQGLRMAVSDLIDVGRFVVLNESDLIGYIEGDSED